MTRRAPERGVFLAALLALAGCGSEQDVTPEYLVDESFETPIGAAGWSWFPDRDTLAVRRVPSDCPGGGAWALRMETGVGSFPSGRADLYQRIEGLQDGDLLILTAWIRRESAAGYGRAGFCTGASDVISCYRIPEKDVRDSEWQERSWYLSIQDPAERYFRIELEAAGVSAGPAVILFDRVRLRRVPGVGGDDFLLY